MRPERARLAVGFGLLALLAGASTCAVARPPESASLDEAALLALSFEVFLALVALSGAALSVAPLERRLGLGPGRLSHRQVLLLAVGTVALSASLDALLELTGLRDESVLAHFDEQLRGARGRELAFALLAFGLAPGVAEELLCRGLLQRGLESRIGAAAAIPISAALFGALHLEAVHAASAGALGLYLGVVAWLAGGVRAAIVCHAANNGVAVLTSAFGTGVPPEAALLAGSLVAAGSLTRVWRRAGRPPPLGRDWGSAPRAPVDEGGSEDEGYSEKARSRSAADEPGVADGGSASPKS